MITTTSNPPSEHTKANEHSPLCTGPVVTELHHMGEASQYACFILSECDGCGYQDWDFIKKVEVAQ